MHPRFTARTLAFLRALKRNNKREWFVARRDRYEQDVRGPMIEVIERLARDFRRFAPEIEASPKTSLYRIYRDTRFSEDKRPLKTHIAASFRWRGLPRGECAGLYLEVAPAWVWFGGGFYAPETAHLVRIREHIADTYPDIDRIARRAAFRKAVESLDGERLTRVPRGYPKDHPAAEYLKYRSFLAGREFPAEFATGPAFYPTLLSTFRAITPLVRFLNEALANADVGAGFRPGMNESATRSLERARPEGRAYDVNENDVNETCGPSTRNTHEAIRTAEGAYARELDPGRPLRAAAAT